MRLELSLTGAIWAFKTQTIAIAAGRGSYWLDFFKCCEGLERQTIVSRRLCWHPVPRKAEALLWEWELFSVDNPGVLRM